MTDLPYVVHTCSLCSYLTASLIKLRQHEVKFHRKDLASSFKLQDNWSSEKENEASGMENGFEKIHQNIHAHQFQENRIHFSFKNDFGKQVSCTPQGHKDRDTCEDLSPFGFGNPEAIQTKEEKLSTCIWENPDNGKLDAKCCNFSIAHSPLAQNTTDSSADTQLCVTHVKIEQGTLQNDQVSHQNKQSIQNKQGLLRKDQEVLLQGQVSLQTEQGTAANETQTTTKHSVESDGVIIFNAMTDERGSGNPEKLDTGEFDVKKEKEIFEKLGRLKHPGFVQLLGNYNRVIFMCDFCPYTTNEKWLITDHLRFHSASTFLWKCPYCSYSVNQKGVLTRHIKVHFNFPAYNTCQKGPISVLHGYQDNNFTLTTFTSDVIEDNEKVECRFCSVMFTVDDIRQHERRHTFGCDYVYE